VSKIGGVIAGYTDALSSFTRIGGLHVDRALRPLHQLHLSRATRSDGPHSVHPADSECRASEVLGSVDARRPAIRLRGSFGSADAWLSAVLGNRAARKLAISSHRSHYSHCLPTYTPKRYTDRSGRMPIKRESSPPSPPNSDDTGKKTKKPQKPRRVSQSHIVSAFCFSLTT